MAERTIANRGYEITMSDQWVAAHRAGATGPYGLTRRLIALVKRAGAKLPRTKLAEVLARAPDEGS